MSCPEAFAPAMPVAEACRRAGGRALLVGGAVRDWLIAVEGVGPAGASAGLAPKDLDLEVHGIEAPVLERLLRRLGSVSLVGQSFAVYKLTLGPHELDVSLPRRDSVCGSGHRGILAVGDPQMGFREAARRRDLTINALAYDPVSDEVEDPWGGRDDLRARRLREVDPRTFGEDPLRALRVPQLAARLQFEVVPGLLALCAAMPLHELPPERVGGELRKLLIRAPAPSWGLDERLCDAVWRRLHPALGALDWGAVRPAVDRAARIRRARWAGGGPRAEALMLASLLHGVPDSSMEGLLDRLDVFSLAGFPVRRAVQVAVRRCPGLPVAADDGALRTMAREAQTVGGSGLWLAVAAAVRGDTRLDELLARVDTLGVALGAPSPLVGGRDLLALGFTPGAAMGVLLERLYRRQLLEGLTEAAPLLAEAGSLSAEALTSVPNRGDGDAS
ncbi:MAG: hypothetical protein ABIO70_04855 [Pseudomonadota bacterium]